jgi:hypothetical protein
MSEDRTMRRQCQGTTNALGHLREFRSLRYGALQ